MAIDSTLPSSITLEKRNLDAALAIGVFLCESDLQHKERILPLFFNLLKCLPWIKFNEASEVSKNAKGCLAEEFSFHFVSLLLEIATLQQAGGTDIVLALLKTFHELVELCCDVAKQTDVQKGELYRIESI